MVTTMRTRPQLLVAGVVAGVAVLGLAALAVLAPTHSPERPGATPARVPDTPPRFAGGSSCANCGTVEAIRTVVVAGGADGAKRTVYRITVRMDDGSFRTLSQVLPPSVAVGETVRITDGAVVRPPPQDTKG
jgi:hypothetical protein